MILLKSSNKKHSLRGKGKAKKYLVEKYLFLLFLFILLALPDAETIRPISAILTKRVG
jgi:hypothetical protein